jgi:hypothetical protein
MLFVSEQWPYAVRETHPIWTKVEAWQQNSMTALTVVNGHSDYDFLDTTRLSYNFEFIDPLNQTYEDMYSQVDIMRTVFRKYQGIEYPDGTIEWVLMGNYYAKSCELAGEHHGSPKYQVDAFDASRICTNPLSLPYYTPPGKPLNEVVPDILNLKKPDLTFSLTSGPWTAPAILLDDNKDPWQESIKVMAAAGLSLYIRRDDVCTSEPRKLDPGRDAVWHFSEGSSGDITNVKRTTADDGYPNVVRVIGTNPGVAGVAGIARDEDPGSPTYYKGNYGERVKTFRSEIVTNNEQATALARYYLQRELGPQDIVTFDALPNPAMQEGDTVYITSLKNGLNSTPLIVSHLTMPDQPDASGMQVTAQRGIIVE